MQHLVVQNRGESITSGVQILIGEEAERKLTSDEFIQKWDTLFERCPWATVFQSSKLITTWYRAFKENYLFILLLEEQGDALTGLLILVQDIGKSNIYVAGGSEAEYQCWLADAELTSGFIANALSTLRMHFPTSDVDFFNIPPNAPLDWVHQLKWNKVCELTSAQRHLMNLTKPDTPKLFRKQQFREKRNRLKRLGELSFEHITTIDRFVAVLPELMVQSDFRKGAKYNLLYFKDKPAGQGYFKELFEQGLLHATILKLNDEIIASIVGQIDRKWVCLGGINTHSPFHGLLSPGYVHFLMLGQHLMAEGYEMFDLTPGNDPYKFRIANDFDTVHSLYFSSPRKIFVKKKLINPFMQFAKHVLGKRGVDIRDLKVNLIKAVERLKNNKTHGAKSLINSLLPFTRKPQKAKVYKYDVAKDTFPDPRTIKVNSFADLLNFDPISTHVTRWDFLDNAMQRFEIGDKVYTYAKDNRLLCCVWQVENAEALSSQEAQTVVLNGFYFHPELANAKEQVLKSVLGKVIATNSPAQVYAALDKRDRHVAVVLESMGFREV